MRSIQAHAEAGEVDQGGFHYSFDMTEVHVTERGWLHIEARALDDEAVVGFGLEFDQSDWQRDQVSDGMWFDYGWGAIFSLGNESDRFAGFLSREIGDGNPGLFVGMIETDVVMINSLPQTMLEDRCNTKFFFGEDDDSEAQVFINFDVSRRLVEFREKDLDYRSNLLRQLVVH